MAVLEETIKRQALERMCEGTIRNMFELIEGGLVKTEDMDDVLLIIRNNIARLGRIQNREYHSALYGYLDIKFYESIINGYKQGVSNKAFLKEQLFFAHIRYMRGLSIKYKKRFSLSVREVKYYEIGNLYGANRQFFCV